MCMYYILYEVNFLPVSVLILLCSGWHGRQGWLEAAARVQVLSLLLTYLWDSERSPSTHEPTYMAQYSTHEPTSLPWAGLCKEGVERIKVKNEVSRESTSFILNFLCMLTWLWFMRVWSACIGLHERGSSAVVTVFLQDYFLYCPLPTFSISIQELWGG